MGNVWNKFFKKKTMEKLREPVGEKKLWRDINKT